MVGLLGVALGALSAAEDGASAGIAIITFIFCVVFFICMLFFPSSGSGGSSG